MEGIKVRCFGVLSLQVLETGQIFAVITNLDHKAILCHLLHGA